MTWHTGHATGSCGHRPNRPRFVKRGVFFKRRNFSVNGQKSVKAEDRKFPKIRPKCQGKAIGQKSKWDISRSGTFREFSSNRKKNHTATRIIPPIFAVPQSFRSFHNLAATLIWGVWCPTEEQARHLYQLACTISDRSCTELEIRAYSRLGRSPTACR